MQAYRITATERVGVRTCTEVTRLDGADRLEQVVVRDVRDGSTETLPAGWCFVFIGAQPRTDWLPAEIQREERGYVLTGSSVKVAPGQRQPATLETSMPGVFAAGDVRQNSMKRIAAAVGEGSTVIRMCHQYLNRVQQEKAAAGAEGA